MELTKDFANETVRIWLWRSEMTALQFYTVLDFLHGTKIITDEQHDAALELYQNYNDAEDDT